MNLRFVEAFHWAATLKSGCFLDGISMVVLTIAVLLPTVQAAGFDLVWSGIFVVLAEEMSQITPPAGFPGCLRG